MSRRALILANPIAGGGRARAVAPALRDALTERGFAAELRFTAGRGDARSFAAESAHPDSCDVVVAVGGDGTLNEVLNGMPDPSLPLAQLPMGTANVLACELGIPRSPERLAGLIDAGQTRTMAVGLAGDRRFLLFAGIGLDGAMVERLEQVRRGTLGKWKWVAPVLHVVRRLPTHDIALTTDTGDRRDGLTQVLITQVHEYGGVFRMPREVCSRPGQFAAVCFRQRTRLAWLWTAFRAFAFGLRPGRDCEVLWLRTAQLEARTPTPYQLDGDLGGHTPVRVTTLTQPARIVVP
ncbi:MAG: diacylglycerol/lipid kinase family protein [Planctomycetota bacterium]|jgi:diacylglycerol kinase (ATP)